MKELTIAAVQIANRLGSVRENTANMLEWVTRAASEDVRLVVFPECSLTGYSIDRASEIAIYPDEESILLLEHAAIQHGVAVGYGFIERRDSTAPPFNTYAVVSADGRLVYRKAHLGASEQGAFSAGEELCSASVMGVCMGVQLCWEGHIPDIATTLRAQGAELLLAPHAVGIGGARRMELWNRYLPARAFDNGMYVAACNALRCQVAADGDCVVDATVTGGGLAFYAPDGSLIDSYEGSDEHMITACIGGTLPRDTSYGGMRGISYFDRRRPELYR